MGTRTSSIYPVFFTSKVAFFLRSYRARPLPVYKHFPAAITKTSNATWSRETRHGKATSRSSDSSLVFRFLSSDRSPAEPN